jgi:ribosome biogenesis GTPase
MTLEDLGYNSKLEEYRMEQNLDSLGVGRVILEHRDRYTVKTVSNEFDCELIGNLSFTGT